MPLESLLTLALGGLAEAIAGKTLDLGTHTIGRRSRL